MQLKFQQFFVVSVVAPGAAAGGPVGASASAAVGVTDTVVRAMLMATCGIRWSCVEEGGVRAHVTSSGSLRRGSPSLRSCSDKFQQFPEIVGIHDLEAVFGFSPILRAFFAIRPHGRECPFFSPR